MVVIIWHGENIENNLTVYFIIVKCELYLDKTKQKASLVTQWLRIALQCRGHWFDPWSRKTWHTSSQLSHHATNNEPVLWSPGTTSTGALALQKEKPLRWEAHVPQLESSPRVLQLKKVRAAMKTQYSKKKNKEFLKERERTYAEHMFWAVRQPVMTCQFQVQFSSFQLLSGIWLFWTPRTAAH